MIEMEDLRKKTFYTIFTIISLFAILFTIIYNIQTYHSEYQRILRNLTKMRNFIDNSEEIFSQDVDLYENDDLHNRKVIDYEVYTFILDRNNNVIDKISHSDNTINIEILNKVIDILSKNSDSRIRIGCLYFTNYAYNLNSGNYLAIVKTTTTKNMLIINLLISLTLVGIGEIFIYILAKKITEWITKPVEESFNREKEFVVNASHELKTPLAVMMASIDCLTINKKNEKWINNLKSESDRMNNLITRLLDLSKSENYLTKENLSQNDLSMIVEKRALTFESLAFEKKVKIETHVDEKINFLCNKEGIDELVSILIDNAISHSNDNSSVIVNLFRNKTEIILEVINEGEAISPDECEKIFERFYRNDKSHNRKNNRYGLGLAIAKNIVEGHGGKITAFSKNGHTTFKSVFKEKEN